MTQNVLPPLGFKTIDEFQDVFGTVDIEDDESDRISLSEVISVIIKKYDVYLSFVESLLQPDSDITSMQESSQLNDAQREELYVLYKQLNALRRQQLVVGLHPTMDALQTYASILIKHWLEAIDQLQEYVRIVLGVWDAQSNISHIKEGYFG